MNDTVYDPFRECFFCGADLPPLDPARLPDRERLAFDPGLGRLWRVCGFCLRWNPVPLGDRWEVLEACDRLCRDDGAVMLRGERLTLFRVRAGQLVRVGDPPRAAFVDWRYTSRLDAHPLRGRGWIDRLLRLPERPLEPFGTGAAVGAGGLARGIPAAWVGSPFIEHGMLLTALFMDVPLAERCPDCGGPCLVEPFHFGDIRLTTLAGDPAVMTVCALCAAEVVVPLARARAALRAGVAIVERLNRDPEQIAPAVPPIQRAGGPDAFIQRLCRREPQIGAMAQGDRLALWISLDEQAEAEALRAEWQQAEELVSILDELTEIPGFEAFRERVRGASPGEARA